MLESLYPAIMFLAHFPGNMSVSNYFPKSFFCLSKFLYYSQYFSLEWMKDNIYFIGPFSTEKSSVVERT